MNVLQPGDTVEAPITKHLSYYVTHNGWGLTIMTSRGPITVLYQQDGSVRIGSAGHPEDDEV